MTNHWEFNGLRQWAMVVSLITCLTAQAHGGIGALDGLLTALILIGLVSAILIAWLIFTLALVFAKEVTKSTFRAFRKTLYGLTIGLIVLVIIIGVQDRFDREFLLLVTSVITGVFMLTELSIFLCKKAKGIKP